MPPFFLYNGCIMRDIRGGENPVLPYAEIWNKSQAYINISRLNSILRILMTPKMVSSYTK